MSNRKPTPKQEAFLQAYLATGNGYQAYCSAYNAESMTRQSIEKEVKKLLAHPLIAPRIEQSREKLAEKTETTLETIAAQLDEAYEAAKSDPKGHTGMVAAAMGKAKLFGLIINKSEDVTPRRSSTEVLAQLHRLLADGNTSEDGRPSDRAEASSESGEAVPTVPGHGTA